MQHYHVIVQAYRAESNTGDLLDTSTIDLMITDAPDEERAALRAMQRAKRFIQKQNYRISSVIEHDEELCSKH